MGSRLGPPELAAPPLNSGTHVLAWGMQPRGPCVRDPRLTWTNGASSQQGPRHTCMASDRLRLVVSMHGPWTLIHGCEPSKHTSLFICPSCSRCVFDHCFAIWRSLHIQLWSVCLYYTTHSLCHTVCLGHWLSRARAGQKILYFSGQL